MASTGQPTKNLLSLSVILMVCEMFLDDNVANNEICIEGYTIVQKNRNRHGGEEILYIKECIQYTEITNLAGSEVEGVWANIQCDKQHLALGIIQPTGHYPPTMHILFLCWITSTAFFLILKI